MYTKEKDSTNFRLRPMSFGATPAPKWPPAHVFNARKATAVYKECRRWLGGDYASCIYSLYTMRCAAVISLSFGQFFPAAVKYCRRHAGGLLANTVARRGGI